MLFFVQNVILRKPKGAEISEGRRLRAIGELVGGIAYEFNNLVTPILLEAKLLKAGWSCEPALISELQIIANTARRSADLTRRLLTFGRRTEVRPTTFALPAIIDGNSSYSARPSIVASCWRPSSPPTSRRSTCTAETYRKSSSTSC